MKLFDILKVFLRPRRTAKPKSVQQIKNRKWRAWTTGRGYETARHIKAAQKRTLKKRIHPEMQAGES